MAVNMEMLREERVVIDPRVAQSAKRYVLTHGGPQSSMLLTILGLDELEEQYEEQSDA